MKSQIAILGFVFSSFLLAPCFQGQAQQTRKLPRVGFLWDNPSVFPSALESFHRGLRDLGWIDGKTFSFEPRWSEGKFDRLNALAEELVRLDVNVIVAPTSIYTGAAKRATSLIPIVFLSHADPIASGHVVSLARPGGNITGFSLLQTETNVKSLELLKETVRQLTRVGIIWDPTTPSHPPGVKALEVAAPALGLRIQSLAVNSSTEFENAFSSMMQERARAFLVLSTPLFISGAKSLAELAIRFKLPSMFGPKEHAELGGLMSYGPDRADLWRRGAGYVDRILKGAKPANLPVQQPTKFDFVINLKTAKQIGLIIPPNVLARADKVIK